MKLDGSQRLVLTQIAGGSSGYGRHNHLCRELRKLGLVKLEMHPSSVPGNPDQPHWFLTEAGRIEFSNHQQREQQGKD